MARWAERIYRALLAVYPAEFRDEYGAEMTGAFRAQYRAEGNRGWRFWTETIADISTTAWKEQTDRRQEIGIRMALGAGRSRIVWLITSYGLRLTAIGIVLGAAGAFAASKALQRFLFGITPSDPVTYAAVGLLIFVVALAGCYLPASKAAGLDPSATLRAE